MRTLLWIVCSIWEIVYKNLIRARYLKGSQSKLIRVAYRVYRGQEKSVQGITIKKGDLVAEIHLSNLALTRYREKTSPEHSLYRDIIAEFQLLSRQLTDNPKSVVALRGITLLAPAVQRLGFETEEMQPGPWATLNYIWLRFLRKAFSPRKGSSFKALDTDRQPVEMWASVKRFTERF